MSPFRRFAVSPFRGSRGSRGFTLIELLIVMGIIGVLLVLIAPAGARSVTVPDVPAGATGSATITGLTDANARGPAAKAKLTESTANESIMPKELNFTPAASQ